MEWGNQILQYVQIHRNFKGQKQNKKTRRKMKGREEKRQIRRKQGTHGRATQDARPCAFHHGKPKVGPTWSGPEVSRTLHFGALLVSGFLPWIIRVGPIGLLLLTSSTF